MCGIAGIVRADGRPVDREVLGRMSARLAHRGPDQEGAWLAENTSAALAVRRLAVIDPAGSRQPVSNENGSVLVVCNGEIYNFRELRADLAARGHTLRTQGDTEVLAHLYEDLGPEMLGRLVGMFAFALWDAGRRRLLLARDRLGQKPLYWWHGPAGLVFASEVAALLECPDVPRAADRRALGAFLRFGYVPAPATGFAGIAKLPAAHYLVFDAASGRVDGPARYWDIPRGPAETGVSAGEWRDRLRAALSEAVRSQLVSDVPLGLLLSGGVDSSVIAALAAGHILGRLRTFTARFAEGGWDESAYARRVAQRLGTDHAEIAVEPRCVEALPELVERQGEPFADSSAIAMYYLAREARRGITVALSGDGGDESFGGYPRHAAMMISERLGPALRRALAGLGRRMRLRPGRKSRWNALRRFLAALDLDPLPRYLAWRSLFSADELRRLCAPDFAAEALADDPLEAWTAAIAGLDSRPWVDRAMAIDLADYLPNDCLAKVDIASMRHGLEVRSPFLDHRVVELARRMPVALKWRPRFGRPPLGKAILRDLFGEKGNEAIADCGLNAARATAVPSVVVNPQFAIRNPQFSRCGDDAEKGDRTLFATARKGSSPLFRLPRCVLRRGKMGFGVPVSEWLAGRHAEWMREILLDPPALSRGLLAPRAVEEMIAAHTSRRADHGERLWALVCLELWFRTFRL